MSDMSGPVTLPKTKDLSEVSPFNPLKPHVINHARLPGIVDHRTAKKTRADMVYNGIDTSIIMSIDQLARDYLQISLSHPDDDASAGDPSVDALGGSGSNFLPSSNARTTSIRTINAPVVPQPVYNPRDDNPYRLRFGPRKDYRESSSDEESERYSSDTDASAPKPVHEVPLDPHFDLAFDTAFSQESINKIHQLLKDATGKVEGKRPLEKKISEAWVSVVLNYVC